MVDKLLRERLGYFCETGAELTDDQKLDIVKAAPEFYTAASWLSVHYTVKERSKEWLRQKQLRI